MRSWLAHYRHPMLALALISVTHLIFILLKWHQVPLHHGLPVGSTDPDPWMRLGLVREWLASGDWYNHIVSRSNAPYGGVASPWTRPLDMVIALLVKLQPDSVEMNLRLMRAALLLPWIWMTLLLVGMYRLVRELTPVPAVYLMASVLVAAMPVTWNYFGLGNADHHAPLAVLFIWALGGVVSQQQSPRRATIIGLLLALMLWISFEALILIAIIYAWYGIHWLRGAREMGRLLAVTATAVALFAAIAIGLERPQGEWLTPIYDSISIVYVVILGLAAALAWFLDLAPPLELKGRMTLAAVGSAVLLVTLHAIYPLLFKGPLVNVTPFVIREFLPRISEVQPLFHQPPLTALALLVQPLAALVLCLLPWCAPQYSIYGNRRALPLLFFLATTLLLFISQQRWSYYLYPLTACIIAPFLAALFTPEHDAVRARWPANRIAHLSDNQQALRRLPVILGLIGLPLALGILNGYYEDHFGNKAERALRKSRESCYLAARQLIYSGELNRIDKRASLTLLAPTDLGAEILFFTPHRIIASNYHREGDAIEYVWGADTITKPEELRRYLKKRRVDALLICPTMSAPAGSILQGLLRGGTAPHWLHKIPYMLPATEKQPENDTATLPAIYKTDGM